MPRTVWDLRFPPPRTKRHEYPISAIPGDTPSEPLGPYVLPGAYTVRLTVDGKAFTRALTVKLDPPLRDGYTITSLPGATPEQIALRNGWLGAGH